MDQAFEVLLGVVLLSCDPAEISAYTRRIRDQVLRLHAWSCTPGGVCGRNDQLVPSWAAPLPAEGAGDAGRALGVPQRRYCIGGCDVCSILDILDIDGAWPNHSRPPCAIRQRLQPQEGDDLWDGRFAAASELHH